MILVMFHPPSLSYAYHVVTTVTWLPLEFVLNYSTDVDARIQVSTSTFINARTHATLMNTYERLSQYLRLVENLI